MDLDTLAQLLLDRIPNGGDDLPRELSEESAGAPGTGGLLEVGEQPRDEPRARR